jgi:hypothetical protein
LSESASPAFGPCGIPLELPALEPELVDVAAGAEDEDEDFDEDEPPPQPAAAMAATASRAARVRRAVIESMVMVCTSFTNTGR